MLEHAYYSVISPEGCAAILWKEATPTTNSQAATALKLTAADNLELGIIDQIIEEPIGGAHRDPVAAAAEIEKWVVGQLRALRRLKPETLVSRRYERFRKLGSYHEAGLGADNIPDSQPPSKHRTILGFSPIVGWGQEPTVAKKAGKAAGKKSVSKKASSRKPASKKSPAGSKVGTKKVGTTKKVTKKPTSKKATTAKAPSKKTTTKKSTAKKAPAKKPTSKKAPVKKAPTKKTTSKKAPAKKAPTKAGGKSASTTKLTTKKSGTKKVSSQAPEANAGDGAPTAGVGGKKTTSKKTGTKKAPTKAASGGAKGSKKGSKKAADDGTPVTRFRSVFGAGGDAGTAAAAKLAAAAGIGGLKSSMSSSGAAAQYERLTKSPFTKRQLEKFRMELLIKRKQIVGVVTDMETEALGGRSGSLSNMPQHMADAGSDTYDQSLNLDLANSQRKMLKEIDDALLRLDAGTYGICEHLGKAISAERLESAPWARFSIEGAREIERLSY
jgi:RNA polymerase-binding transcription factor DksA